MAIDLKPLREYLKHGIIKSLAQKNGIEDRRGWLLVRGLIKNPLPTDIPFIDDCIEEATMQKRLIEVRNNKIKSA